LKIKWHYFFPYVLFWGILSVRPDFGSTLHKAQRFS
jgi:hypothetical protein